MTSSQSVILGAVLLIVQVLSAHAATTTNVKLTKATLSTVNLTKATRDRIKYTDGLLAALVKEQAALKKPAATPFPKGNSATGKTTTFSGTQVALVTGKTNKIANATIIQKQSSTFNLTNATLDVVTSSVQIQPKSYVFAVKSIYTFSLGGFSATARLIRTVGSRFVFTKSDVKIVDTTLWSTGSRWVVTDSRTLIQWSKALTAKQTRPVKIDSTIFQQTNGLTRFDGVKAARFFKSTINVKNGNFELVNSNVIIENSILNLQQTTIILTNSKLSVVNSQFKIDRYLRSAFNLPIKVIKPPFKLIDTIKAEFTATGNFSLYSQSTWK